MRVPSIILTISIAMLLLAGSTVNRAQDAQSGIEPIKIQSYEPSSLEDKISLAELIILGTVRSAAPEKPAKPNSNITSSREPYLAVVAIEKVYKGSPGENEITVRFLHGAQKTVPPLAELKPGERTVLFLRSGGDKLELITPFSGKAGPDAALLNKLDAISKESSLTSAVQIAMAVETQDPALGQEIIVKVVIANTGAQSVVFNSTPNAEADLVIVGPGGAKVRPAGQGNNSNAAKYPLQLVPGAFFGYRADVSKIFKLSDPGTYTITAEFKAPPGKTQTAWSGVLRAKPVTVEIK